MWISSGGQLGRKLTRSLGEASLRSGSPHTAWPTTWGHPVSSNVDPNAAGILQVWVGPQDLHFYGAPSLVGMPGSRQAAGFEQLEPTWQGLL